MESMTAHPQWPHTLKDAIAAEIIRWDSNSITRSTRDRAGKKTKETLPTLRKHLETAQSLTGATTGKR
jgi:hypothetical protein